MNAPAPPFDPEDPRLTAYALGELLDPADHAAVEQTLRSSPEARAAVQEIRALTAALVAEYEQERLLAADDGAPLPNVVAMVPGPPTVPRSWPRRLLLAAAVVLLLASVAPLVVPGRHAAINPPKSAFYPSAAAMGKVDAPANAPAFPAAPITLAVEPPPTPPPAASSSPSLGGLIADADVRPEGSSARGLLRAPYDPTLTLDRLTKDDQGQTRAAKPSKALTLDAVPLSQGGLEGVPVAAAPFIVSRSFSRRAVMSDDRSEAKLIQHAENPFVTVRDHPLSTLSPGMDTASYADLRRSIESGHLPPPAAVQTGEWINAFPYDDPVPAPGDPRPFAVRLEAASCPWNARNRLIRIGVAGHTEGTAIQVEFNPAAVTAYRLIGAGHDADQRQTALYEVVPADQPASAGVSLTVKLSDKSGHGYEETLADHGTPGDLANASPDFKFAAAVASFAQILGGSPYRGDATLDTTLALARQGIGNDPDGRRTGFVELVRQAQAIQKAPGP